MTLVPTAGLVAEAARRGGAVAAFNVITLEHAEAICAAATESRHRGDHADQRERGALPRRAARSPIAAATAAVARGCGRADRAAPRPCHRRGAGRAGRPMPASAR